MEGKCIVTQEVRDRDVLVLVDLPTGGLCSYSFDRYITSLGGNPFEFLFCKLIEADGLIRLQPIYYPVPRAGGSNAVGG